MKQAEKSPDFLYNKDEEFATLEQDSQKKKIGLWSHPNSVAPWDFRRK